MTFQDNELQVSILIIGDYQLLAQLNLQNQTAKESAQAAVAKSRKRNAMQEK